ncbi:Isocitrate/Isopropylmalate dehydrogenase-like protein [Atractiella rhizophila]|nr:Isocitrate/Isopropylmalate dehydrogenase-like protein [Atractiella rhizophila]
MSLLGASSLLRSSLSRGAATQLRYASTQAKPHTEQSSPVGDFKGVKSSRELGQLFCTVLLSGTKRQLRSRQVSLISGDGIGPEISESVQAIYEKAKVPVEWEEVNVAPVIKDGKQTIPDAAIENIRKNTVALKGPLATPSSFSVLHMMRKLSDGTFLQACRKVAAEFPQITYEEDLLDRVCLRVVQNPAPYADRVMVMPNLYGDILSDMCAGLIGGLGLTPSGNIGKDASIFEAVHGSAPDIAGQGKANPTALLLSSLMMLRHMRLYEHADRIEKAALGVSSPSLFLHRLSSFFSQRGRRTVISNLGNGVQTIAEGKSITGDLGGKASTKQFTDAIIAKL